MASFAEKQILNATATGAQTLTSEVTEMGPKTDVSYVAKWTTSDGAGDFKLEVSNDYGTAATPTWVDITPAGLTAVLAANGKLAIARTDILYKAIRMLYVQASGTTTVIIHRVLKGR